MPEPTAFLHGFGMYVGLKIAGYTLIEATATHKAVTRNHEYTYHTMLQFMSDDHTDPQALVQQLTRMVQQPRTIYTAYGNPYMCEFGQPVVHSTGGGLVTITSEGHSVRQ
jgi:hypothetical protein